MINLLLDHNFGHHYLRQLLRRIPEMDYVTAFDEGLSEVDDPKLLRWSTANDRVLLTHDRKTIPNYFAAIINAGETSSGVIVVPKWVKIADALDELEIRIVCTDHDYWINRLEIL